ncbi:hypothetical protein [Psychrobacter alimentarius]|uniref:hypothetical protein n=1 Tax=Psychrobacter alimentarius TaxID=261164 RepID=UPI003C8A8BDE
MLNNTEFVFGSNKYNTVRNMDGAFVASNKRPTEEEIYSDIYANRELISDHIANKVSDRFKQGLISKGLLSRENAES